MTDITQLFLYIPGVIIFLVGSGQVRNWFSYYRKDACVEATVKKCDHIIKKDSKGREVFNYYNVTVEYRNLVTTHVEVHAIKSPNEYVQGQVVRLLRKDATHTITIIDNQDQLLFHPLVTMVLGALLILLALFQNTGREMPAMICLALIFLGTGISLIINYFSLKKRNLREVPAEIVEVYERQISKETKIIRGSKSTYYPIVKYQLEGKDNIRRCNINSSSPKTFQVGESMKLYFDPEKKTITEKHAVAGALVAGVVLLAIGVLTGASIVAAVL